MRNAICFDGSTRTMSLALSWQSAKESEENTSVQRLSFVGTGGTCALVCVCVCVWRVALEFSSLVNLHIYFLY